MSKMRVERVDFIIERQICNNADYMKEARACARALRTNDNEYKLLEAGLNFCCASNWPRTLFLIHSPKDVSHACERTRTRRYNRTEILTNANVRTLRKVRFNYKRKIASLDNKKKNRIAIFSEIAFAKTIRVR